MSAILMRRAQAIERLGVSKHQFSEMVRTGVLRPRFLPVQSRRKQQRRAYYLAEEIDAVGKKLIGVS